MKKLITICITILVQLASCNNDKQVRYANILTHAVDSIKLIAVDSGIRKSNFVFHSDSYGIFFKRELVIRFCDSVLHALPPYHEEIEGPVDSIWATRFGFEYLKTCAKNNTAPAKRSDFLHTLFQRFNPLVMDSATNDIPPFILAIKEQDRIAYKVVSPSLDTTNLAYSNYGITVNSVEFIGGKDTIRSNR